MDDWLKWAIPLAAGAGLLATGGAAAPALAPLLGAEAAAGGAAAAGAATAATGAGTTAVGGLASLGGATAANVAPTATGAMSYVTAPLLGGAESAAAIAAPEVASATAPLLGEAGVAEGMSAGAYSDVGGEIFAAANPTIPAWKTALATAGKAGATFNAVNAGVNNGGGPGMAPPAPMPVFQGPAPQISQGQGQQAPMRGGNEFARMLMEQSERQKRGMLG